MSPAAVDIAKALPIIPKEQTEDAPPTVPDVPKPVTGHKEPLKLSGALDQFQQFDVTPVIGREFVDVDLAEWLNAPNSDELLRDLAITISQRGVVFFRKQDNLTDEIQKRITQRLGELTGKPATSTLHIHPLANFVNPEDQLMATVSSRQMEKMFNKYMDLAQTQTHQWHSDIAWEAHPAEYSFLRMKELPVTGGDTLWASGYEVYDRVSPPLRAFFDTLTVRISQPQFKETAERLGFDLVNSPRGAPENIGDEHSSIHPFVRTNPVTGWRSIFPLSSLNKEIQGLCAAESQRFLDWMVQLVVENHDLQVRLRWQNANDCAIWDNRSAYHAATPDYIGLGLGARLGSRTTGVAERPYFDPQSTSRREALGVDDVQRAA
ncbi:taurine catabolism dioxygenase [Eremomyces bilateralis CBS 781.70]|uniref:Taurine catabolism dioxygenase n=1 Tax=Eremomyces bilateralis CBS 781.70 TaxID=1392243 RepID=A0A6G1G8F2_9PEZI|nr:taurine catabolism dioxygenase [Eremomyces bilateralis CBS 781.70]KAF1814347.1 taurine catabolism dioxygenase [Eremomyces bilateralis CBS 781.70]